MQLDVCESRYESAAGRRDRNQGRSAVKRQIHPRPRRDGPGDGNEGANRAHGEEINSVLLAAQMGLIDLFAHLLSACLLAPLHSIQIHSHKREERWRSFEYGMRLAFPSD